MEEQLPSGARHRQSGRSHNVQEHRVVLDCCDHPVLGDITLVGSPVHLSEAPMKVHRMPPKLGEHTDEILAEIATAQNAARRIG